MTAERPEMQLPKLSQVLSARQLKDAQRALPDGVSHAVTHLLLFLGGLQVQLYKAHSLGLAPDPDQPGAWMGWRTGAFDQRVKAAAPQDLLPLLLDQAARAAAAASGDQEP